MAQNQLSEIRNAYESGDIERARDLIHQALSQNPTPQLYRLAAELALNDAQRDYFLEQAEELDATQPGGIIPPTGPETGLEQPCPYCGTPNLVGNIYCIRCGLTLFVEDTPVTVPPPSPPDRGGNIRRIAIAIIILFICFWLTGLVIAGIYITRNDEGASNPDLTSTALAALLPTLEDIYNPTTTPITDPPVETAVPTNPPATEPPSTPTATPISDHPDLQPGRVTTEDYNFYNAAISPGHQAIAAAIEVNGNWQIVEIDPTSGRIIRQITDSDHVYINPHYSNDGQTLLLKSDIRGSYNIFLADADTGEIIQTLTDYSDSIGYPRWMPDNQGFLYKRYINEAAEVYIGYLDGSPHTRLTDNNRYDGSPASSPDGRTIAMSSFIGGNYEIVVMDRDTGGFQQLTSHSGRDSEPVFSPDGGWIAFESDRGGDYNIWAIRPDGTGLKQVTSDGRNELIPAFSPDGGWLYFQQRQSNGNFSINRTPWP